MFDRGERKSYWKRYRIRDTVSELFWLSRALGAFPFRKDLTLSIPFLLYSAALILVTISVGMIYEYFEGISAGRFMKVVLKTQFWIRNSITLYFFAESVVEGKPLRKVFEGLESAERGLRKLGLKVFSDLRGHTLILWPIIIVHHGALVIESWLRYHSLVVTISSELWFFATCMTSELTMRQLTLILEYIRNRFKLLNDRIIETKGGRRLHALIRVHEKLTRVTDSLSRHYSVKILLNLSINYICLVVMLYFITLETLRYSPSNENIELSILELIVEYSWGYLLITNIHHLISACETTCQEVKLYF
jgi:hypothetical protein